MTDLALISPDVTLENRRFSGDANPSKCTKTTLIPENETKVYPRENPPEEADNPSAQASEATSANLFKVSTHQRNTTIGLSIYLGPN
jgi:hypothetical protein